MDDGLDDLSDLKNLLLSFLLHGDYDYELWGWGGVRKRKGIAFLSGVL